MGNKTNPYHKYLGEEDKLQGMVCDYVHAQYKVRPIPLNTEGRKSTFEQYKFKQTGGHKFIPDLFIPVAKGKFNGLFVELKSEGVRVYKKDGSFYASRKEHHQGQAKYHEMLESFGYAACFSSGFDNTKQLIDNYFKL